MDTLIRQRPTGAARAILRRALRRPDFCIISAARPGLTETEAAWRHGVLRRDLLAAGATHLSPVEGRWGGIAEASWAAIGLPTTGRVVAETAARYEQDAYIFQRRLYSCVGYPPGEYRGYQSLDVDSPELTEEADNVLVIEVDGVRVGFRLNPAR